MKIARICLTNFRCHAHFEVAFSSGVNLLLGENGSGKSSVFEAIGIILFDRSRTGKNFSEAVGPHARYADIEVEFIDAGGGQWKAKRRIGKQSRSTSLSFLQNGEWQDVEAERLQALFGFAGSAAEDVFRTVIVAEQNSFAAPFLESPTVRERIFNRVFGISQWRELADMTALETPYSLRVKELEAVRNTYQNEAGRYDLESIRERRERIEREGVCLEENLRGLKAEEEALDRYRAALQALRNAKQADEFASEELAEAERQIALLAGAEEWLAAHTEECLEWERLSNEKALLQNCARKAYELEGKVRAAELAGARADEAQRDMEQDLADEEKIKVELENSGALLLKSAADIFALETSWTPLYESEQKHRAALALLDAASRGRKDRAVLDAQALHWKSAAECFRELRIRREECIRRKEECSTRQRALAEQRAALERGHCPLLGEPCANLAGGAGDAAAAGTAERIGGELARLISGIREAAAELNRLDQDARALEGCEEKLGASALALEEYEKNERSFQEQEKCAQELEQAFRLSLQNFNEIVCGMRGQAAACLDYEDCRAALERMRQEHSELDVRQKAGEAKLAEIRTRLARDLPRLSACEQETAELKRQTGEDEASLREMLAALQPDARTDIRSESINAELAAIEHSLAALEEVVREAQKQRARLHDGGEREARRVRALERKSISLAERQQAARVCDEAAAHAGNPDGIKPPQADAVQELVRGVRAKIEECLNSVSKSKNDIYLLDKEIEEIERYHAQIQKTESELIEARRRLRLVQSLRRLLGDMGPWLTKQTLPHIAEIATRNFRSITGRSERVLWSNDDNERYVVSLAESAEDGGRRQIAQLSGGEQVALALALRAAMVEVLTDAHFVIFDEPTINLDTAARHSLAGAFRSIFGKIEQAFIITHDNSFEAMADNEIRFTREGRG